MEKKNPSLVNEFLHTIALLKISLDYKSLQKDKRLYVVLVILGLLLLFYYKKDWFIAVTVNGQPVTTLEVFSKMSQQYKSQTLNQMINEKIILQEAQKKSVTVSNKEIDNKLAELEKNVGGPQTLDSLLAQQNQTRESLRDQIKIQIIIEKLYVNEATSSTQEVDAFIEQTKNQLTATDSAAQRKEAENLLKQQKLSKIFSEKFQQLKQTANVKIF